MKQNGAGRKIAVTVWGQRVSPVFDSASTLLIAEIDATPWSAPTSSPLILNDY